MINSFGIKGQYVPACNDHLNKLISNMMKITRIQLDTGQSATESDGQGSRNLQSDRFFIAYQNNFHVPIFHYGEQYRIE